jgi:hypothetical protein
MVDTLVTHANTNGACPNFLVMSPPWLYASSVKNKTKNKNFETFHKKFQMNQNYGSIAKNKTQLHNTLGPALYYFLAKIIGS